MSLYDKKMQPQRMAPVQQPIDIVMQQITTFWPKQHLDNDQFLLHWVNTSPKEWETHLSFSGLCKSLGGGWGGDVKDHFLKINIFID